MLNRFLLIGVGGSGGKTLRYIWRELDFRLRAIGWSGPVPQAFQFLHIDVPENSDVIEADVPVDVGTAISYTGLAEFPYDFAHYVNRALATSLEPLAGWRPDPADHPEIDSIWLGAGQRRVVGNMVALSEMKRIGDAISNSVDAINSKAADDDLKALNALIRADPSGRPAPTVVLVSSLSGGSGSGAFLRIIECLKALERPGQEWLDTGLISVLYAADAFPDVIGRAGEGIEPNSLAAISEFLNAAEATGQLPPAELALLEPAGAGILDGRRAPKTNFIIGGGNEARGGHAMSFATTREVNRAVAKALAMFMLNERVQKQFFTYGINTHAETTAENFTLTDAGNPGNGCNSLGYARVSLGRDLFAEYVQERLAAQALDRLLRGHREGLQESELARDEVLIDRIAENPAIRDEFFDATGLHEIGPHDQVLNMLRDADAKRRRLNNVEDEVRKLLPTGPRVKVARLLDSGTAHFNQAVVDFETKEERERGIAAQEWIVTVRRQFLTATQERVGRYGLPVTIRLLELLEEQLLEAAKGLESAHADFHKEETALLADAPRTLQGLVNKTLDKAGNAIPKFLEFRTKALARRTEAALYDFAAALLRDAAQGLVPPMRATLESALAALSDAETQKVYAEVVERWSTGEVPAHLEPAPNEVLLEDVDRFPEKLSALFATVYQELGAVGGEQAAVAEVIRHGVPEVATGVGTTDERGAQLVRETSLWNTALDPGRPANVPIQQASYEFSIETPVDVLVAARGWTTDSQGRLAEYLTESLADWLDKKSHSDYPAREERFAGDLEQALNLAQPFVTLNSKLYGSVHPRGLQAPRVVMSEVPLQKSAAVYSRVLKAIEGVGVVSAKPAELFEAASAAQAVEISTFFESSMHPVVMSSVMQPIQVEWQRQSPQEKQERFWKLRRARSLPMFVPLSRDRQDALVGGWLTARILGQLEGDLSRPWSDGPISVWTPDGPRALSVVLLGKQPARRERALPALMETLPLAIAEYGSGRTDALEGYMRLIALGMADDGRLHQDLETWIGTGAVPRGAPQPPESLAGKAGDTPEARQSAVRAWIHEYREKYSTEAAAVRLDRTSTLTVVRGWEIRESVMRATAALLRSLDATAGPETVMGE